MGPGRTSRAWYFHSPDSVGLDWLMKPTLYNKLILTHVPLNLDLAFCESAVDPDHPASHQAI